MMEILVVAVGYGPPSGRGGDLCGEIAIGAQGTAKQRSQAPDVASLGNHSLGEETLAHQPHVEGHPARHELLEVLLEAGGVIAAIGDRPAQYFRPDGGDIRAGQRIRTDEIYSVERQRSNRLFAADELDGCDFADVACVDHSEPLAADRHRVNAVPE